MAYATIVFEHPDTGVVKRAPVGFSWTYFFFGPIPLALRGDWKWAIITTLIAFGTLGFSPLVFIFIYNKMYIKGLVKAGYKAKTVEDSDLQTVRSALKIEIPQSAQIESSSQNST